MAQNARPPVPGPFVQPNFGAILEAVGTITFPISKRELLENVGDETVVFQGRNVGLHDLIKDVHDDYFDSEEELLGALETEYASPDGDETEGAVMPTGPQESWQSRVGRGDTASAASHLEPPE